MGKQSFVDPVLGRLTWDEHWGGWIGEVGFGPSPVKLACVGEGVRDYERHRPNFLAAWRNVEARDSEFRTAAASLLLSIFNSEWNRNDEGELGTPLNEEQFCMRMVPESIVLHDNKDAVVYYDDAGLFWGHTIFVEIDSRGKVIDASI